MPAWFRTRESISTAALFFYVTPLLAIIAYSMWQPANKTWGVFSLGLLLVVFSALVLHTLLAQWELFLKQQQPVAATIPETMAYQEPQVEEQVFTEELDQKNAEIQSLLQSQDDYRNEVAQTLESLTKENQSLANQVGHKEHLLEQCELTIAELKATHDRKQQRITQLETKVRDLSYEIKTLLQLTEIPDAPDAKERSIVLEETPQPYRATPRTQPEKQVCSQDEAQAQLKRCIDIAQKMTGASLYTGSNSRFRGIPVDNFALDMRCLFDSLRSENSCTVLFYSPKENKLLFANEQTRKLTGWSPEKFVQNFDHILQEGKEEWSLAIKQLASQSESKVRLILKSRAGDDILLHGLLGAVPTGIFRHHVVVILYNTDQREAPSSKI